MMAHQPRLLDSWTRLVRRRWKTGAVLFGVVLGMGALLLLLTPAVYRSEAKLRLGEPPPAGGVNPGAGIFSFFQLGGDAFANDLELLASRTLAEAVTERMALNVTLLGPRGWHRDSLLVSLGTTRETDEAEYTVRWLDDGRLRIRRTAPDDSLIGPATPGTPVSFGGLTVAFQPWRDGMPQEFRLVTEPFDRATRLTRAALEFERPRREANMVEISYQATDPGVADGVVGATVAQFIRLRTDLQHRESSQAADSLRRVARETGRELRAAEQSLEQLQRSRRLVAPEAQSEALVERHAELVGGLARARSELRDIDQMLRRLDAEQDPARSWTAFLGYPAFMQNETLGTMLMRLTELHAEREELSTRRSPDNTQLRLLDERIRYLDRSLRQMAREYRVGLLDRIRSTEPQVEELDLLMGGLPAEALELGRRQRDVRLLSEVLLLTEQRLRQEELREALTYANVQVVDPPALLDRPVWPRRKLGLAVALILATGTAMVGMVVRHRSDPRLRRADEIEDALGRPLLAVVGPRAAGAPGMEPAMVEALARRSGARSNGGKVALVAVEEGDSARQIAEGNAELRPRDPVRDFGQAVQLAGEHAPVVLVVEAGRTTRSGLRRVARLIEEAGGTVVGAVLSCESQQDQQRAWD